MEAIFKIFHDVSKIVKFQTFVSVKFLAQPRLEPVIKALS